MTDKYIHELIRQWLRNTLIWLILAFQQFFGQFQLTIAYNDWTNYIRQDVDGTVIHLMKFVNVFKEWHRLFADSDCFH